MSESKTTIFSTALLLAALAFCANASAQQVHAFNAAELTTASSSGGPPAVLTSPPPPPRLSEAQKAMLSGAGWNYLYGSWRTEFPKMRQSGFKPESAPSAPLTGLAPTVKTVNNRAFDASFGTFGVTESGASLAFSSTTSPATVVVGFNSTQDLEALDSGLVSTGGSSGYSRSTDGGASWKEVRGGLPFASLAFGGLSGPLIEVPEGDPSVVADSAGNFYYSTLAEDTSFSWALIYKSSDGGNTFGPIAGASCSILECFIDKPFLAIDSNKGNLYLTFTLLSPTTDPTGVEIDEITFSTSGSVRTSANLTQEVATGSNPAVGPNGELYVAWEQFTTGGGSTPVDQIMVDKSTNGGTSFGTPVKVANVSPIGRGAETFYVCLGTNAIKGGIRVNDFPAIAVDDGASSSFKGNVYITWNNNALTFPNDDSDIVVSTSKNGGATWSAPKTVNLGGKGTDQFFPWVSVLPNGKVGITYYDRKTDPNNWHINVSDATSTDGGSTWANGVIESENFPVIVNVDITATCYMGDYNQVINNGSNFLAAWGDNTNGDPDVVFGKF